MALIGQLLGCPALCPALNEIASPATIGATAPTIKDTDAIVKHHRIISPVMRRKSARSIWIKHRWALFMSACKYTLTASRATADWRWNQSVWKATSLFPLPVFPPPHKFANHTMPESEFTAGPLPRACQIIYYLLLTLQTSEDVAILTNSNSIFEHKTRIRATIIGICVRKLFVVWEVRTRGTD